MEQQEKETGGELEVAEQFDKTHSGYRARDVGSLHHVVPPEELRRYLIDAVERGIRREEEQLASAEGADAAAAADSR